MSESPYRPPKRNVTPNSIVVPSDFRMPATCAVCGEECSEKTSHLQDEASPLILAGGSVRTTQLDIPYCDQHAGEFQQRLRNLHMSQGIGFFIMGAGAFLSKWAGPDSAFGVISIVVALISLVYLAVTIFVLKRRLYDVFIERADRYGRYLRIESRFQSFIESIEELNRDIM